MAEDTPAQQGTPEQAPDNRPVPVSSSEHVDGEVVTNVPIDDLVAHIEQRLEIHSYRSHRGPLPAPESYREYADIIPNGAERIMAMAEKEQDHRHWVERKEQNRASSGVNFAFVLGALGMGISAYALRIDQPLASGVAFVGTLATLAGVFIKGTAIRAEQRKEEKQARKELKEKKESSDED